jgi:hypothetical protein
MRLMTYSGLWVEASARHPEAFMELAPPHLQEACRWNPQWSFPLWNTTLYGYPRFRLALLGSRYAISGGPEVAEVDQHGNHKPVQELHEFLMPRYVVQPEYHELYLLEMWRPPAWYYENGFGGQLEYSETGTGFHNLEPVFASGGWEGMEWRLNQPFAFPRDVPPYGEEPSIEWAMWAVHKRMEMQALQIAKLERERQSQQKESDIQEAKLKTRDGRRSNMFLEPAVSMAGAYKQ